MAKQVQKPVAVSREEVLMMQWSMIARWKPRADVWPFTYGNSILASTSALTGMYFNMVSRKALRLGSNGLRSSYLPLAILPPLVSALAHVTLVSSDILLKETACSPCVEMKAVVSQLTAGVLYPVIFGPVTSMYFATMYYTYAVPEIRQFKELVRLWWRMTKPKTGRIQAIAVGQALLAAFVTYKEMTALETIEAKMDSGAIVL